ncbi:transmembrane and coiled-coil domains-containing protein 7 [Mortierella sp. AM989]|nr:transmembrane and coiled-coil domains-containing protein 7 [Mortierella sp. AM989]
MQQQQHIPETNTGNVVLDNVDPTSQMSIANVDAQTNAKAMEVELKSNLRKIHALVGTPVDTQNMDQVLQQRLEALETLRSEETAKQEQQEEKVQHEENNMDSGDGLYPIQNDRESITVNHENNSQENDTKDVRTEFVNESIRLLVDLEEVLLRLIRDREINDPTNDKELLGLMDQRMIHTMLEIVVCWGIYPCLLPGVGLPLNRRVRSNIVQKELFTTGNVVDKPVDRIRSTNLLWSIIEPLARITVAYSPKVTRFTTLGSILASRHVPDLYAALLQLAYRPLPKPKETIQNEGEIVDIPEQEVSKPKPKKMTPGSLLSKSAKPPPSCTTTPSSQIPTPLQQTLLTDEGGPERARQLQQKEESAKLFHDLFWHTDAARSLESLTILLSSSSPMHPTPAWIKSVSGRFLSQILLRPGGVRVVLEYMQGGSETVKLDQLEKAARLVTSVPDQMSSVQEYYRTICPELLEILEINLNLLDPERSKENEKYQIKVAPPSPQLVQTTTFVVSKLLAKNPAICQVEIVAKEVGPLWKWGTRANRKAPVAADTVPRSHNDVKSRSTTIEEIDDNNQDGENGDEDTGLDPVVASEYEITKAIMFLNSFLVGNEPSPLLFQAFLSQAAQGLYQLYEFLTQIRSVLREKAKEILVVYFRILDPNDTVEVLKAIVMRRRLPVSTSKPWQNIVAHDGQRIGNLVEMGTIGESYFAPGPTGGAVLRRRSTPDRNALTQLELDVDIFLDLLSDLETSGHEGEILGDLYMYLLDEYQAGKARGTNAVSPRRMLTMLQLILNMTQKLGPSIMSKVTQIVGLANNILEHHLSPDATEITGNASEDVEEESDMEILGLVLTLLSAILTDNEQLSQQDRHLLSLTLVHIKKLSDHPLIEIRRVAHDLQTLIPTRLSDNSSNGEGIDGPKKTEMEIEMEKYASALAALQDSLLPVRAHGLHILRDMILAKSIVLTRSIEGSNNNSAERELDHALDIFVQHVQEPDSFIYLNAVKGLAALTDAHGPEILRKLMRIYSNEDGKQKLDTRLRIGEALVQTVQRCGEALGGYLDALLPGLYKVMNTAVDKSIVEARDEEKRRLAEKAKAKKASEALLTPEEKQSKWKAENEAKKTSSGQERHGAGDEDDEDAIVDEVSLLRSSALTILATAAENCPTALLPEMRYLVDWVLSILDLDRQTEVRRAATLVIVLLFRALGSNSLYRIEGDQLKRAYRTLRYVEEVDDDALCRAQARTGIADLDGIVRMEMSGSKENSGNRSGMLKGMGDTEIRFK